jgi:hypothetical protein
MGSNSELIGSLVNDFFSQAGMQKNAADSTNPQGAGSEELKEKKTGHEVEEISGDNTLAAEKDRGAEMEADLKDSEMGATDGNAQLATEDGAQVKESEEVTHPQDNPQSPKELNADEAPKMEGDNMKVTDVTTAHAAPSEISKVARAEKLSNAILQTISALNFQDEPIEKEASVDEDGDEIDEDVLNSFLAYSAGFERGLQKKAEDINDVVESGLVPDQEQAAALLDATAVQNPEAVLPEEAQPEAELSPDDAAALEQLAGELDAAGITPEELMEAQAQVEAIKEETGATDEDIIQVLQEEAAGVAPEAAAEEMAPEAAAEEVAAEEMPKEAAEDPAVTRKNRLLDTLQKLHSKE